LSITKGGTHTSKKVIHALILLNCDEGSFSDKVNNKDVARILKIGPVMKRRRILNMNDAGVANIFLASEPLTGKIYVEVTARKTKVDWAKFVKQIADDW
jgi:hypothetical protein